MADNKLSTIVGNPALELALAGTTSLYGANGVTGGWMTLDDIAAYFDYTNMDNMVDGASKVAMTVAERAKLAGITGPMLLKGEVAVAADFPTSGEVVNGWTYLVTANVTDNDVTKTNTGQTFANGDEITWNGTNWSVLGNSITGSVGYALAFDNTDLTAGVLTVTHSLGQLVVQVSLADNNGDAIVAPISYVDNVSLTIDLSAIAPITGTWNLAAGIGGRDIASIMRATQLDINGADYDVDSLQAGYTLDVIDMSARTINIRDYATHPVIQGDTWIVADMGSGVVTIQAAAGVTLNGVVAGSVTLNQYGEVYLRAVDPVNDIWRVIGGYTI